MNNSALSSERKNDGSFYGKSVLITGASEGLGEAFSRYFAEQGANLILIARSYDKLLMLKQEIEKARKVKVFIYKIDLSNAKSPFELYESLRNDGLEVDILINNAGFGKQDRFENPNLDTYTEMIQLNITSVVTLCRLFICNMLQKGSGGIINLSSTAAFQPLPYFAVYAASKAFILSFSEALWAEYYKKGIKVIAVCPGHVRTAFHKKAGVSSKKLFAVVSPDQVVRDTMLAYAQGLPSRIYGRLNFLLMLLTKILSRKSVIKIASKIFKPS